MKYMLRTPWIVLCFTCLAIPSTLTASSITTNVNFGVSGQNMWGAGSAFTFDYNKFLGFQGDKSFTIDGISDWGYHNWVGASVYANASWKAGINVGVSINSGSVDVAYPVAVSLNFPSVVTEGSLVTIGSSFSLMDGASLDTVFPNIVPHASAVLDLAANIDLEGCWYFGCDTWHVMNLHADYEKNLLDFLGFVPTNPGDSATYALPGGWGSIEVTIPGDLNTTGSLSGLNLVSKTGEFAGEFVDAEMNLLKLGELIPGPVGLAIKGFNEAEEGSFYIGDPVHMLLNWNVLDVNAGAIARVTQEFQFAPDLWIDLMTKEGDTFASFRAGDSVSLEIPDGLGTEFELTPVFRLENDFTNETGLRIDPTFYLMVLEASGRITIHDIPFYGDWHAYPSIGPLFENQWIAHGLEIPVYSNKFSLNIPSIEGNPFSIQIASEPVPEPGSIVLLSTGLGLIGLAAWRRKK